MKVRAVTVGAPLGARLGPASFAAPGRLARRARDALTEAGVEVQTVRLATPPLGSLRGLTPAGLPAFAAEAEVLAQDAGFEYLALGAVDAARGEEPAWRPLLERLPEVISSTRGVFGAAQVASREGGINLAAARACGDVITAIARQTADGFGNLRFAALANCPPHIPFFPAAYHDGGERLTLGLALEAADLAVEAFGGARDLAQAEARLVDALAGTVGRLHDAVAGALSGAAGGDFAGIDLSLAPFPADDRSIAGALERLGLPAFGGHGTLFLASFLTACLRAVAARVPSGRFGFSGLMLPVLEDSLLARRAAEGKFGVDSLLLYAAVCGLGLDTVPVPGDTTAAELGAIVLDVAALAVRLDKPLTARLFPVPGKRAGDPVRWDFAFFAPSRVLPVRDLGLGGALAATGRYNAEP